MRQNLPTQYVLSIHSFKERVWMLNDEKAEPVWFESDIPLKIDEIILNSGQNV